MVATREAYNTSGLAILKAFCHPDKKGVNRHQNIANLMKIRDFHFY